MTSVKRNNTKFIDQVHWLEDALDSVVDTGSDDELFIASYLQGHLAVIAKPLEIQSGATIALLDTEIKKSLQQAFANKELEPHDQLRVYDLWQRLYLQCQQ